MKFKFLIGIGALLFTLLTGCSTNPYSKTNQSHLKQTREYTRALRQFPIEHQDDSLINYGKYPVATTNFNLRRPNYVILHHTAQNSVEHTLRTFTLPRTAVSSHYVISREGKTYQMLNDYYRAWHAGTGKWGNDTDINSTSIGIELDNNGDEPFTEVQILELLDLLKVLKDRYDIPAANFIGHSDIAPTRKVDPNITFPWKRLAEQGFGLWYEDPESSSQIIIDGRLPSANSIKIAASKNEILNDSLSNQNQVIKNFISPEIALRIIGYDTRDLKAAIKAFKLHFIQKDIESDLTDEDLKILYHLYKKYM